MGLCRARLRSRGRAICVSARDCWPAAGGVWGGGGVAAAAAGWLGEPAVLHARAVVECVRGRSVPDHGSAFMSKNKNKCEGMLEGNSANTIQLS